MNATWPADRFYWSILDAKVPAGPIPPGLRPLLEEDLPESLEDLHAVCAPAGDGRTIVCAARRDALARLDPNTRSLSPQVLPEFVRGHASALNLLVGDFEPMSFRRQRARRQMRSMAAVIACAALLALGLLRRTAIWQEFVRSSDEARAGILAAAGVKSAQDLQQELAKARRESDGRVEAPADAALTLAALLSSWPTAASKPTSISIAEKTIGIALTVDGDAAPLLQSFKSPRGWVLEEPQVASLGTLTRVTMLLRREEYP